MGGIGNHRNLSFGETFLSKRKGSEEVRPPKPFLPRKPWERKVRKASGVIRPQKCGALAQKIPLPAQHDVERQMLQGRG